MSTFNSTPEIVSKAHPAYVGVGYIRIYAFFLDILEGVCHETAIAAMISVIKGAIYQVLRTEGHQDTCGLLELPFQSTNCTEGPTRATGTLEVAQKINDGNFS